jgi:hypothetical protein
MKTLVKWVFLFCCIAFSGNLFAQVTNSVLDNTAPYLRDKKRPVFSLSTVDGKEATQKDIPSKYKYTCYIIFSPDCSHCEHEATELSKNADKFKNVFFVWDSYREMDLIKKFSARFNLAGQSNIIIGRDAAFTLPSFFRPKMTPFVALYNNNSLVKVWESGVEVPELLKIIGAK